jgi:hypothetical protein
VTEGRTTFWKRTIELDPAAPDTGPPRLLLRVSILLGAETAGCQFPRRAGPGVAPGNCPERAPRHSGPEGTQDAIDQVNFPGTVALATDRLIGMMCIVLFISRIIRIRVPGSELH